MDEEMAFNNGSGDKLAALISRPPSPNGKGIILLHCFTCTKHHRIMRNLSDSLTEKGFSVLRFDFSGNGESEGRIEDSTYSKMIQDVGSSISVLRGMGITKIGIAGHSMGAMLALLAAAQDRGIGAVAFIAGSSQAARVREVFPSASIEKAERDGSAEAFVYGRTIKLKREFLLDVERYNVGHAVATLGRPLLIVHGSEDEVIPVYHARQLFNWATEPKRLEMIERADHLFKDDKALGAMKSIVAGWFLGNL